MLFIAVARPYFRLEQSIACFLRFCWIKLALHAFSCNCEPHDLDLSETLLGYSLFIAFCILGFDTALPSPCLHLFKPVHFIPRFFIFPSLSNPLHVFLHWQRLGKLKGDKREKARSSNILMRTKGANTAWIPAYPPAELFS